MPSTLLQDSLGRADRERLRYYRERFEKLKTSRLLSRAKISNQLTLAWTRESGQVTISHDCPPEEEILHVATQVRPFMRFSTDAAAAAWAQQANREYRAAMKNPRLSGLAIYADDRLLTPRWIFNLFMEAEGAHLFADQKRRLDGFGPWRGVLESSFLAIVATLVFGPFQLLADTIGICSGDRPAPEGGIPMPAEERIQTTVAWMKEGDYLERTPFPGLAVPIPAIHLFRRGLPAVADAGGAASDAVEGGD